MLNLMLVRDALRKTRITESSELLPEKLQNEDDSFISLLVHDFFGGEILKTRSRKGWHFYNRIEGLRIDFTQPVKTTSKKKKKFEDIRSSPEETSTYLDKSDYSNFRTRFIRAFEEIVGLDKNNLSCIA